MIGKPLQEYAGYQQWYDALSVEEREEYDEGFKDGYGGGLKRGSLDYLKTENWTPLAAESSLYSITFYCEKYHRKIRVGCDGCTHHWQENDGYCSDTHCYDHICDLPHFISVLQECSDLATRYFADVEKKRQS